MIYLVITRKNRVMNCIPYELTSEAFKDRNELNLNARLGDILNQEKYHLSHNPKRLGAEYHG